MADVLFCTDTFFDAYADRLKSIVADLEVILLREGERVTDADRDRITIAFFSDDAWPDRAADFFGVATRTPALDWFHTMSAGVDSPVFASFLERGVTLTNSSGASAEPIARTAMMYLLALSRDLAGLVRAQDRHEWNWARWFELAGRSVAVVGWGPIGQEVARLADAFGMHPTIVRRSERGDEPYPVRTLDDLAAVAVDHDAMVVALPLTEETAGIVSAEVIAGIGPRGYFVNVGRGELVDQPALVAALNDGSLGGAGLDVVSPEPLPPDDPLWDAPNLILTPHNSGSTDGSGRRAAEIFLANLERRVAGLELANTVESSR